jgi:hypothetical protein
MSLLLYAVSRDRPMRDEVPGLSRISAAGLTVYAELVDTAPGITLEELLHYERTVERLMFVDTILPMRFGSVLESEQAVRDFLSERDLELSGALARVDGAAEYGVRIAADVAGVDAGEDDADPAMAEAGPGELYMRARLAQHHRSQEARRLLDSALDGLVRAHSYRDMPEPGTTLSASFLVGHESEPEFRKRITELWERTGGRLSWSGPWPAYSFAGGMRG